MIFWQSPDRREKLLLARETYAQSIPKSGAAISYHAFCESISGRDDGIAVIGVGE